MIKSLIAIGLFLFLAGCAAREISAPVFPIIAETKAEPLKAKAAWEVEWEKTLQAAKREGRVVIMGSSPIPVIKEAVAQFGFAKKYGFEPEFIASRGAQIVPKLSTERTAGLFLHDILITGMNTYFGAIKPAGWAEPLEPVLILPEILDSELWYGGKLPWGDAERRVFKPSAYPNANVAVNTELAKPEEIKSYRDLLHPKWKGKIMLSDPTAGGGTALKGFGVLGFSILDLDYFRQLAKQVAVVMKDERLLVDWLARGKYSILMFPHSVSMTEYTNAGAPLAYANPVEGTYLSVGGANVILLNKSPHPNAAKIFINWYLSREGQTLYSRLKDAQSARLDVPAEGLDLLRLRQPGMKYFTDADKEEWLARDPEFMKAAEEIFGHLIK